MIELARDISYTQHNIEVLQKKLEEMINVMGSFLGSEEFKEAITEFYSLKNKNVVGVIVHENKLGAVIDIENDHSEVFFPFTSSCLEFVRFMMGNDTYCEYLEKFGMMPHWTSSVCR